MPPGKFLSSDVQGSPLASGILKAKTELCATVSDSLSLGFFRIAEGFRGRVFVHRAKAYAAVERDSDLAIDLCRVVLSRRDANASTSP